MAQANWTGETINTECSYRTVLYYPTIAVPDPSWLRRALLYWDEVASIVPWDLGSEYALERVGASKQNAFDLQFLLSEGAFRPIHPHRLLLGGVEEQESATALQEEFQRTASSGLFRRLGSGRPPSYMPLHLNKISDSVIDFLEDEGLAEARTDDEWLPVEENAALLYMSLLAKRLAECDGPGTVTGTDSRRYMQLAYGSSSAWSGSRCLMVQVFDALPVPRPEASLADILKFKSDRQEELGRFLEVLDDLQDDVARSETWEQVEHVAARFQRTMNHAVRNLKTQLRDARVPTILGSFTTLLGHSFLPPVAMGLASATGLSPLPLSVTLPLGASYGALKLSQFLVDRRNVRRDRLRSSPYSYLYHASSRSIIP